MIPKLNFPAKLSALSHSVQQLKGRIPLLNPLLEFLQADGCGVVLLLHGCPHKFDIVLIVVHCLQQTTHLHKLPDTAVVDVSQASHDGNDHTT